MTLDHERAASTPDVGVAMQPAEQAGRPARTELRATYLLESCEPLERVAEVIAGEQSSGTFLRLAGETDELK